MLNTNQTVTVTLSQAREVYDTDSNGKIIEDSKDTLAKVKCELVLEEDKIVAFGLLVKFPKVLLKEIDNYEKGDFITYISKGRISEYISSSYHIDLFRVHHITISSDIPTTLESLEPFTCNIKSETFQDLCNQFIEYSEAIQSFEVAINKLSEFANYEPYGLKQNQSEIYSLLNFIQSSLASADTGYLYSWYQEKQYGIQSSFKDMLRRKNGNHPGYKQAQNYIYSNLFSYKAPSIWINHPPKLYMDIN